MENIQHNDQKKKGQKDKERSTNNLHLNYTYLHILVFNTICILEDVPEHPSSPVLNGIRVLRV